MAGMERTSWSHPIPSNVGMWDKLALLIMSKPSIFMQCLREAVCTEAVRGCFSPSLFILQRGNTWQEYWSIRSERDGLGGAQPYAYICTRRAWRPYSFTALSCDSWEQCQSKSRSAGHVFLTSDWQYLIGCRLWLPVKLLRQWIEPKIGFFTVVVHSQEGTYSTYGEIVFLKNEDFSQQCADQLQQTI